jgi:hypothetical protein
VRADSVASFFAGYEVSHTLDGINSVPPKALNSEESARQFRYHRFVTSLQYKKANTLYSVARTVNSAMATLCMTALLCFALLHLALPEVYWSTNRFFFFVFRGARVLLFSCPALFACAFA